MAKVSIPSVAVHDDNTVVPKPRGRDALDAFLSKGVIPEPKEVKEEGKFKQPSMPITDLVKPLVTGEEMVIVSCKENARYRYGKTWLVLIRGKKVTLPIGAAKEYRAKGKVDY